MQSHLHPLQPNAHEMNGKYRRGVRTAWYVCGRCKSESYADDIIYGGAIRTVTS